jgi:hypothetical protein
VRPKYTPTAPHTTIRDGPYLTFVSSYLFLCPSLYVQQTLSDSAKVVYIHWHFVAGKEAVLNAVTVRCHFV